MIREERELNEVVSGGKRGRNELCKKGRAVWRILRKELHTRNTGKCYIKNRKYNNQVIDSVAYESNRE